ncbi:MAG TPA: zinc ribbon domain-containing protein [Syntrophomonas sp.]|nr:zinc ribbon domain-containing protein [Syntrophomonas sp.]
MCFRPPELNKVIQKCIECGTFNKPGMKVCKKCGAELGMMACPECGFKQPESNAVCTNCGFNGQPGSGDPAKKKT